MVLNYKACWTSANKKWGRGRSIEADTFSLPSLQQRVVRVRLHGHGMNAKTCAFAQGLPSELI